MDFRKCASSGGASSFSMAPSNFLNSVVEKAHVGQERVRAVENDVDVDLREVYFLILHFLSYGPCQRTSAQLLNELLEHKLLPRRYHAWFSRDGVHSGNDNDDGISVPLSYNKLAERLPHIEKDHLVKLLRQLLLCTASQMHGKVGRNTPNAAHVPTLLGSGSFSLVDCNGSMDKQVKPLPAHLRWPHMKADQVHGLSLREIGGGFAKHHRAPSVRSACYAIAKPSTMVQKMQNMKRLRGHRNAVYCAIFDRSGRYVITGSDDRLVKIWSMETAFCLVSCRGHEGDITDLAVSSNNALVASASNDFVIRAWRLPDGLPISVLQGHTGAVTAIAFSPRPGSVYQLLSSSDDGSCRIWDARYTHCTPRIYVPRPSDVFTGKSNGPSSNGASSSNGSQSNRILCCAFNANGTVFVTGSSDTYARVWSACKSNTEESEQPIHEMDVLSGHENDVNYVQFSGCAVASRSSMPDILKEENIPKFKNSWFCHDNIVTCSRDGSAIIWIPKSRRAHGKSVRWTKAYHLKVPPPPLPPQPPRGGPRMRILPTPRGVNMIVWSLDNHFVLAAIMDCRICVWNAVDGSLVHSLTGHTASSYVLDVHPFNPRIAMSAGYDGRTIVWDIWEGIPIHVYEIGRVKLVDGKFSPDGTSIVLSDDVGQIYLLNTGQGESQKDAKYDQFFLGDYRPLIRDVAGNAFDQETQLNPHRRNIEDPLCDSSMIPYPEPYQTMFQQRRLGALGVEWHPSSIKFAVGPDISLGQDYQLPPLEDLDRMIEPLPEFIDALFWEPEIEVISDDTDSEYNVAEECSSEGELGSLYCSSPSDPECSAEESDIEHGQKDGLRRSRRRKHQTEAELMTSSRRHVKKRNLDEHDGSISGSNGAKKLKSGRKVSKRKSSMAKASRPQRVAARNALNMFSRITGTSTDGDDEDDLEEDTSNRESELHDSNIQVSKSDGYLKNVQEKCTKGEKLVLVEDIAKHPELLESQSVVGNRKKLVLKFSLRDSKRSVSPKESGLNDENHTDFVNPSSKPLQETRINISSKNSGSSLTNVFGLELSQNQNRIGITRIVHPGRVGDHAEDTAGDDENKIKWGGIPPKHSRSGDVMPGDASIGFGASFDAHKEKMIGVNGNEEQFGADALHDQDGARIEELVPSDGIHKSSFESSSLGDIQSKHGASAAACSGTCEKGERDFSQELKENPSRQLTRLKIITKKIQDSTSSSQPKDLTGAVVTENPSLLEHNQIMALPGKGEGSGKVISLHDVHEMEKSQKFRADFDGAMEENASNAIDHCSSGIGFSVPATDDAISRTRSMKTKVTARQLTPVNNNFRVKFGHELVVTSMNSGNKVMSNERLSSSKMTMRSRSARNRRGEYYGNDERFLSGWESSYSVRKLSWLTLSKHEEGYRYIPQQGDEVVYLRQGHQEYIESTGLQEKGPWSSFKGYLSAVETCKVESLDYATVPGSGDSCCKITLRFIDPLSGAFGKAFKLTLPELINFSDFVVEKARYDSAISRNWTHRDKCLVWWRNENGDDGSWWEGRIVSVQAKSADFPDSPWERYCIRYKTDPTGDPHLHSPWELHDLDIPWEHPHIDFEIRDKLLYSFNKLEQSVSRKQDCYGIQKLNEASHKLEFFNRFPVPLCPEVIRSRLENNYHRSLEAVKHDIRVMMENAQSYFGQNADLSNKMKRLSEWYTRKLPVL